MILQLISLAVFYHGRTAQSPEPSPALDCSSALLVHMSACMTYVEEGSNLTMPAKGCCRNFSQLIDNHPNCFCRLIYRSETFGLRINTVRSLMLPSSCRTETLCSVVGSFAASPVAPDPPATNVGPVIGGPVMESSEQASQPRRNWSSSSSTTTTNLMFLINLSWVGSVAIGIF